MGILSQIISPLLGQVKDVIDAVHLDPSKKADMEVQLASIQAASEQSDRDLEARLAEAASANIQTEAKSQSWLPRNARPYSIFMFANLIFLNYLLPVISQIFHVSIVPMSLPDWFYKTFSVGFTGYVAARTTEKIKNADN